LVDARLLQSIAPVLRAVVRGEGKVALAHAPTLPLADEIVSRAKTGFGVPTRTWMDAFANAPNLGMGQDTKGLASRRWSQLVLAGSSIEFDALRAA
jgi:asparagine synthase (glutamine-hydrolysing)